METYAFTASPAKRIKSLDCNRKLYPNTERVRDLIMSPAGWLSDPIINAAQLHLKEESRLLGFQETILGMTLAYDVLRQWWI